MDLCLIIEFWGSTVYSEHFIAGKFSTFLSCVDLCNGEQQFGSCFSCPFRSIISRLSLQMVQED